MADEVKRYRVEFVCYVEVKPGDGGAMGWVGGAFDNAYLQIADDQAHEVWMHEFLEGEDLPHYFAAPN